jgi:hypothetical protein
LLLNGIGLFAFALLTGWFWFVALLGQIVVWPVIPAIPAHIPGGARARRRVHMEAISHGLLLMGRGPGGPFIRLSARWHRVFFGSALSTAWMFSEPPPFNALFGTRGLAMDGEPFKDGLAINIIFLTGRPCWPCI